MRHILDMEGVTHYEWTNEPYETDNTTVCICLESDLEGANKFVETENDVDCADCLLTVARYTDHTFKKGDMVRYDDDFALIKEVDPTHALILLECQDGGYSWDFPNEVRRIRKEEFPRLFWRIKMTNGRYKFWIGPNFGSCTGSFVRGTIHNMTGKTIREVKRETRKMLRAYVEGRV